MRTITTCLLLLILTIPAHSLAAGKYLDNRKVKKSPYYTGVTGSAQLEIISQNEWITERADVADELGIRNQGFVIADESIDELVYGIANRLLEHWPGYAPPIVIFIQGDRSPLAYGAQTTFHGEIFIDYSVLLHAESEDELAAVIGHELSHVLLGHGTSLKFKQNIQNSMDTITAARELYAKAEALEYNDATATYNIDPSAEKKIRQSAMQQVIADRFYKSAHASFFSRGSEHAADKLAMDLLVAAGYSPMGIKASLERMAHAHNLSTQITSYLTESSQAMLNEALGEVNTALAKSDASDLDVYFRDAEDDFTNAALDFGKKAIIGYTANSHPVPEKRVKQITDYLYENYSRKIRRRQLDTESATEFRDGEIGAVIDRYRVANEAIQAIGLGEFEAARISANDELDTSFGEHAYLRYVAFVADRNVSDKQSALSHIESMDSEQLMPLFASTEVAEFLAESGRHDHALEVIDYYESIYGDIDGFYPPKIILSASTDGTRVAELTQACFDVSAPDSELSRKCVRVSGIERVVEQSAQESEDPVKALGGFLNKLAK